LFLVRSLAITLGVVAFGGAAAAGPPGVPVATECGAPPPAGAGWFYLGAPGRAPAAQAARKALAALRGAFDEGLPRDPSCLHLEILDTSSLNARYRRLGHGADPPGIVGFHNRSLGSDSTVFVVPQPGQGLEVVIVHEVLHALSHRFSSEAGRRRLGHMVEGATEFLTRAIAGISLGIPEGEFRTGYGLYVEFYAALMRRLGDEGLQILTQAYFVDGYHAFEQRVDQRLGVSLRAAARKLEEDDLRGALLLLR
jgi:hypothetical protein